MPATIDWVLIADPRHVNYLSGFWINPLSSSSGERGLLYLRREGEAVLLCDNFALASSIGTPHVDRTIEETWYDQSHGVPNRDQVLFEGLRRLREKLDPAAGLVEGEWLPLAAASRLGLDPSDSRRGELSLGSLLRRLRRRKEPDEIELLKRCMRAGEAGQSRGRAVVRPGTTELDVFREIQSAVVAQAGAPVPIYGDFRAATAERPNVGGPPTDYRLREGDALILDFSVVIAGYRCDFTNTVAVGKPRAALAELVELCRMAMQSGERALVPGAAAREVYQAVADSLARGGRTLSHHAGHGLGLGHPEAPSFVPASDETLELGEVVTLEPGLYVEGIGGVRIENNYLVTGGEAERLSRHQIEL